MLLDSFPQIKQFKSIDFLNNFIGFSVKINEFPFKVHRFCLSSQMGCCTFTQRNQWIPFQNQQVSHSKFNGFPVTIQRFPRRIGRCVSLDFLHEFHRFPCCQSMGFLAIFPLISFKKSMHFLVKSIDFIIQTNGLFY